MHAPPCMLQAAVDKLRDDTVVVPLHQQAAAEPEEAAAGAAKTGTGSQQQKEGAMPLGSAVDPDLADVSAAGLAVPVRAGAAGWRKQGRGRACLAGRCRWRQPGGGGRAGRRAVGEKNPWWRCNFIMWHGCNASGCIGSCCGP